MLSLILMSALSAVGDVPAAAPQAARRTYAVSNYSSDAYSYYGASESYYGNFSGGCGCCCPTDNVNLFFPCPPAGPCAPFAPCAPLPICAPRVFTFPCPTPIRTCPCPPPARPAPCN